MSSAVALKGQRIRPAQGVYPFAPLLIHAIGQKGQREEQGKEGEGEGTVKGSRVGKGVAAYSRDGGTTAKTRTI